jgi:hypothetical protein
MSKKDILTGLLKESKTSDYSLGELRTGGGTPIERLLACAVVNLINEVQELKEIIKKREK